MVVYNLNLDKLPANCMDCPIAELCLLPLKIDQITVKVAYLKRRHPDCPLLVLPDDLNLHFQTGGAN